MTDETCRVLEQELSETQSALKGLDRALERLGIQLEQFADKAPLVRQDLEKRVRQLSAKQQATQALIRALELEEQAWMELTAVGEGERETKKAVLAAKYGQCVLDTNRARTGVAEAEDEARLERVLKLALPPPSHADEAPAAAAGAAAEVLDAYYTLSDFYSHDNPGRTRAKRQELGQWLVHAGVPLGKLDVLAVTWNMGNAAPNAADLPQLIPMNSTTTTGGRLYDVVVVGVQECGFDLSASMQEQAAHFKTHAKQEAKQIFRHQQEQHQQHGHPVEEQQEEEDDDEEADEDGDKPTRASVLSKAALAFRPARLRFAGKVEKLSKRAVTSRAGEYFASLLLGHLGAEDFLLVRSCEFSNMRLFAFVRREHAARVSHIDFSSQSTGVGGIAGNKGGVAVSFRFQSARFCFISCHLAAHRKYMKDRNADCAEVLNMAQRKLGTRYVGYMSDWDMVFMMGDLNYRLGEGVVTAETAPPPSPPPANNNTAEEGGEEGEEVFNKIKADHTEQERKRVLDLIASSQWAELIKHDQLRAQQAEGKVLFGFTEASTYAFPPTFKLVNRSGGGDGNGTTSTRSLLHHRYAHNRLPAYCDRILWYVSPALQLLQSGSGGGDGSVAVVLSQADLFSPQHMTTSDHNPVCSRFLVDLAAMTTTATSFKPQAKQLKPSRASRWLRPSAGDKARLPLLPSSSAPTLGGGSSAEWQIVLWDLSARGLTPQDATGKSDPYVVAYSTKLFPHAGERGGSPTLAASRTGVCFQTLQCAWKNTTLVVRAPAKRFPTAGSLRGAHVTLAVRDFDFSSFDDSMGEVVLPVSELVAAMESGGGDAVSVFLGVPLGAAAAGEVEHARRAAVWSASQQPSGGRSVVEFHLPIVLNGRRAGVMSGRAQLRPLGAHRVAATRSNSDYLWKGRALVESVLNQQQQRDDVSSS